MNIRRSLLLAALLLPFSALAQAQESHEGGASCIARQWSVPSGFIGSSKDAKKALEKKGVKLPKGATATYHPSENRLFVRASRNQLDEVEVAILKYQKKERKDFRQSKLLSLSLQADDGETASENLQNPWREALRQLHLDSVEMENASVTDALVFLRRELRRNELKAPLIEARPLRKEDTPEPESETFTINMQNISGEELLQLICEQTGYLCAWEDKAVVLYHKDIAQPMPTRQWYVKEELFEQLESSPSLHGRIPDMLKKQGIEFPPGSSALYDSYTLILEVKNTRENLHKLDTLLAEYNKSHKKELKNKRKRNR